MHTKPLLYVVDDGDDYRFIIQRVFMGFAPEYALRLFSSGDALCQSIQTEHEQPDLILMDFHMPPGPSGYETLLVLKQQANWSQVPVLMMSNAASDEEKNQCLEAGARSFLTKPTTIQHWQQFVKSIDQDGFLLNSSRN